MKKRKRRILIIIAILVAVFLSFMIGTGFTKRTDVALGGYSVSEDGKTLTFQAGVTSSIMVQLSRQKSEIFIMN